MKGFLLLTSSVVVAFAGAQSLLDATAPYSQLSDFNSLLESFPDIAASLVTNLTSSSNRQTILVPSNDAFDDYRQQRSSNVSSLSSSDLGDILNYHTLQGALSSSDLETPGGLVSSTALDNPTYAQRERLDDGSRQSQVVYISSTEAMGRKKIKARQINALMSTDVQGGEGREVELEPTPGNWSGGVFYVVNGFLTLPVNQTDTMTAQNLTSFVLGLNRTNVTDGTNEAQGLTCLCPNNDAFEAMNDLANAGDSNDAGPASLLATLTRHGLTGSFYSTNFTDGDLIYSQNGYPILVTRAENGSIFLNDAQVVGQNFIANTGCVHALDRIMGFLDPETNQTTPANDPLYSDANNIPSSTPQAAAASTAEGGAIPTDDATGGGRGEDGGGDLLASGTGATPASTPASTTGAGAAEASATGGATHSVRLKAWVMGLVTIGYVAVFF